MHILFVTATRIGDAVLSTGLLSHVIERFPGARLTIAAGPVAAPLFEAVPGLAEVLVLRKRRLGLHWLALYRRAAARRWGLVGDLRAAEPGLVDGRAPRARRRRAAAAGPAGPGVGTRRQLARQAMARRALCRAGAAPGRRRRAASRRARRGAGGGARAGAGGAAARRA